MPAAFCGVYGLRTTPGVVPTLSEFPAFPLTPTTAAFGTIGPLARSVADLEAVYEVIAVPDPHDPSSAPYAATSHRPASGTPGRHRRAGDDSPGTGEQTAARPVAAVLHDETGATCTPQIEERLARTCRALEARGYAIKHHVLPDLREASELWAQITGTDLIRSALPVFGAEMTESGRRHVEDLFGAFALDDFADYQAAWVRRSRLAEAWAPVAARHPLIVAPVAGMTAPPLDFDDGIGRERTLELFDRMRCVPWVNLLGLPALALPNGIQLVARPFHEADLFTAAYAVEPEFPVTVATPQGGVS